MEIIKETGIVKKYENMLKNLQDIIQNESFDAQKNKEYLEKVLEIYEESKSKNYNKVKKLIINLEEICFGIEKSIISSKENMKKTSFSFLPGCSSSRTPPSSLLKRKDSLHGFSDKENFGRDLGEVEKNKEQEIYSESEGEYLGEVSIGNEEYEKNIDFVQEKRNWDYKGDKEDDIEIFSSIEMISEIFLENLKEKIGQNQ